MGQQQLLLIVLGVIIVGIAIVVGINLFNANAEESAIDTIVSEGTNLAALAQQYYKKPIALGGGGNDFTGFTIPPKLANSSIGNIGWALAGNTGNGPVTFTFTNNTTTTGYAFTSIVVTTTPDSIYSTVTR